MGDRGRSNDKLSGGAAITTGISIPSQNAAWLIMMHTALRMPHSIEAACNFGGLNQSRDWICLQATNWKRIRRNECRISVANAAAPPLPSLSVNRPLSPPSSSYHSDQSIYSFPLIVYDETDCRKYEVNGICGVFRESESVYQHILCEDTACIPNCCKK